MVIYEFELGIDDWVEFYLKSSILLFSFLPATFIYRHTVMEGEDRFNIAVKLLTDAVQYLKPVLVPSPYIFDGTNYDSMEDFLYFFERYALATYGNDTVSWLQILPEFLCGDFKNFVNAFGRSKDILYVTVGDRLLSELNFRTVGDDNHARFLNLVHKQGETLTCYFIRLEVSARKIPYVTPVNTEALVRFILF